MDDLRTLRIMRGWHVRVRNGVDLLPGRLSPSRLLGHSSRPAVQSWRLLPLIELTRLSYICTTEFNRFLPCHFTAIQSNFARNPAKQQTKTPPNGGVYRVMIHAPVRQPLQVVAM